MTPEQGGPRPQPASCGASPRPPSGVFFGTRRVLAHALTANHPEVTRDIRMLEGVEKCSRGVVEFIASRLAVNAKHRDARRFQRVKAQWIGEVDVEADEKSALTDTNVEDLLICPAGQLLLVDRGDIVPRGPKGLSGATSQVLVELDPHATSTNGPEARRAP